MRQPDWLPSFRSSARLSMPSGSRSSDGQAKKSRMARCVFAYLLLGVAFGVALCCAGCGTDEQGLQNLAKSYKILNCRYVQDPNSSVLQFTCPGQGVLDFLANEYVYSGLIDPASNSNGTPPYYPFLVRQSDCSLTRVVLDSTATVVEQDADYQDAIHAGAQIPTTPDVFPGGCNDPPTGISFQQGAIAGKFANGNEAVAIASTDGVLVYVVNSEGTMVSQQDYPTVPANNSSAVIFGIASADLNGDGIPDIVVASELYGQSPGTLSIFLGNGDGTFKAGQVITVPQASSANLGMTIQDVNGDGKPDLVAVTSAPGLDVFLGNGDGTFQTGIVGPVGAGGSVVVSADFNCDGKPDLATSLGQILIGNGDGTFHLLSQTIGAGQIGGIAAADYNKDGKNLSRFSKPND